MRYLFIPLWAAMQITFAHLFLSSFLAVKHRREEVFWVLFGAWLLTTIFDLFAVRGIHSYLMYLLTVVMILLSVYGEYGSKGLCLLIFTVLIPVTIDLAVLYLIAQLSGIVYYLVVTAGKALPFVFVLVLRRLKVTSAVKVDGEESSDTLLLRQHMEMQQESMTALEQNYRLQRKSAHEFEHHLQVLRDLLAHDAVEPARDYLDRLKKNRSICVYSVNSHHPVMDVILNQKYQTARENEIKMQIRVNDLSAVDIPTDSLVVVLTNLLDNAIEACRRLDGYREIFCSILYDDALFISIRNTSLPVEIVEGQIPTSKADSLSHGFGLMSVSFVLDELGADYTFSYEEGWFHFAAEIE